MEGGPQCFDEVTSCFRGRQSESVSLEEMIGSIMISRHKLASFSVFEYMYSYYRNNMMKHCRHMLIWGQSLDPPSCH